MRQQGRHVLLLADNFGAHNVDYEPTNVTLEFFEPNLTSHVQPLDAGIIRCQRALDLEEAGAAGLFKINVLEAMQILKRAWNDVKPSTIENCWRHSGVAPAEGEDFEDIYIDSDAPSDPESDVEMEDVTDGDATATASGVRIARGWQIVLDFATSDLSLPMVEHELQELFGVDYDDEIYRPALAAVMEAEGDQQKASHAVKRLMPAPNTVTTSKASKAVRVVPSVLQSAQLSSAEDDLMATVKELKNRCCFRGPVPPIDQLVDPLSERQENESNEDLFADGDEGLAAIVSHVRHQQAVARGDVIEIDSDSEEEDEPGLSLKEVVQYAEQLERVAVHSPDFKGNMELAQRLRQFRGHSQRELNKGAKQTSLESYFTFPKA